MIKETFPDAVFNAPATEQEIAAAEAILCVRLPEQLRDLYLISDGFREPRGNAKYLLSLTDEDSMGSLVSMTKFMWDEYSSPDFKSFIFFGSSSADELWGINWREPNEIVAYHHHMEDQYENRGADVIGTMLADYKRYEALED